MILTVDLLWRGPLDSCIFSCRYCPFAKRPAMRTVLAADRAAMKRFVAWVAARPREDRIGILFTPWGEGLTYRHYRQALVELSHLPQVRLVAIQTNAVGIGSWIHEAASDRIGFWATWHPTQITWQRFRTRVLMAHAAGMRISVGAVAIPIELKCIAAAFATLPAEVPRWLNAQIPGPRYIGDLLAQCQAIDPHFLVVPVASRGRPCRTGRDLLTVDGEGDLRRCHQVDTVVGNCYRDEIQDLLFDAACPRTACSCPVGLLRRRDSGPWRRPGDPLLRTRIDPFPEHELAGRGLI